MTKRKRSPVLIAVSLVIVLLIGGFVVSELSRLGYLRAMGLNLFGGFEGAKAELAGATPLGPSDWTGYGQYSPVQLGSQITGHASGPYTDHVYWLNYQPTSQVVRWDRTFIGGSDALNLLVETQQSVALENLGYMGDPLNWNIQQQFEMVQVQYNTTNTTNDPNRNLTRVVNGESTSYALVKRSFLIVPAELHITISIMPINTGSSHDSGWQEGDWNPMQFWFKLDFFTWKQQGDPWNSVDGASEWDAGYWKNNDANTTVTGQNAYYSSGGGFPVSGWIEGYLLNLPQGSGTWDALLDVFKGASTGQKAGSSVPALTAKTNFVPSLGGRAIELYSQPGQTGNGNQLDYIGRDQVLAQTQTFPWAGGASVPAYFPITMTSFGTVTEGNVINGYTVNYPAVNYRIRVLYVVWGTFTYLWTVQTAQDNGYVGWETRSSTTVHTVGWWEALMTFLMQNPWIIAIIIVGVVFMVILLFAVFAPWILPRTTTMLRETKEAYKGKARFSQGPK